MRILAALICMLAALAQAAEVAVTHPGVIEDLGAARVRDVLLGRVTTWKDGAPVIVILVDDRAADAALVALAGRDRVRLLRGWKRLLYGGAGAMPLEAASVHDALDLVRSRPGAIAVLGESPGEGPWRQQTISP